MMTGRELSYSFNDKPLVNSAFLKLSDEPKIPKQDGHSLLLAI
jgi:hypothetical protein